MSTMISESGLSRRLGIDVGGVGRQSNRLSARENNQPIEFVAIICEHFVYLLFCLGRRSRMHVLC